MTSRFDDISIRPQNLTEFVGQERLKQTLSISIQASKQRGEPLIHTLFYGPPGFGKTTLSNIISNELSLPLITLHAPSIESPMDISIALLSMETESCIFIDEIHRLRKRAQEQLYTAMEDYKLPLTPENQSFRKSWSWGSLQSMGNVVDDKVIDEYHSGKVHLLPRFTLLGATTDFGKLEGPFRDRFGLVFSLSDYSIEDMVLMIMRTARVLGVRISNSVAKFLAERSRNTPRHANRLVMRCRDMAQVKQSNSYGSNEITLAIAQNTMNMLDIDDLGLTPDDRGILLCLVESFDGGPTGIEALALTTNISSNTIVEICEPHLVRQGLMQRTPKGRIITGKGLLHLGVKG